MLIQARPRPNVVDHDTVPPNCVIPIVFYLDPNEYQKMTSCEIERVRWNNTSERNVFNDPLFFSERNAGARVNYPIILRGEATDDADRLLMKLPIRDLSALADMTEECDVEIHFVMRFRGAVEIPFLAHLRWIPDARQFNFISLRRTTVPKTIYANVGLFVALIALISLWNNTINQSVHRAERLAASEDINHILLFLAGFFGLGLANLLIIGRKASTLRAFLLYPELYLGPASIETFRSRVTAVLLGVLLVAASIGAASLWTWRLPTELRERGFTFFDKAHNQVITADRVYTSDTRRGNIVLVGASAPVAARHVGNLQFKPFGIRSWFFDDSALQPMYRSFQARYADYDKPADCTGDIRRVEGSDDIVVIFDAADDFANPCIRHVADRVRMLLTGRTVPDTWLDEDTQTISFGKRVLSRRDADRLLGAFDELLRAENSHSIVEKQDQLVADLLAHASKLGPITVPRLTFVDAYREGIALLPHVDVERRVQILTRLRGLFAVYQRSRHDALTSADVTMIVTDFDRVHPPSVLATDSHELRAHWRLLLDVERAYGNVVAARDIRNVIERRIEGAEYYIFYLEECIRTGLMNASASTPEILAERAKLITSRRDLIRQKLPFLRERLRPLRRQIEQDEALTRLIGLLQSGRQSVSG
jgi:hypothetical protein